MSKHVWIVELRDKKVWIPTADNRQHCMYWKDKISAEYAMKSMHDEHPNDLRIIKYVNEAKLTEELYECNLLKKAGTEVEKQFYKDIRYLEKKRDTLFDSIKHGDEKHQAWLKESIENHFKKEEK